MTREAQRRLTYTVELPGGQVRLREMILYVCRAAEEMPRFGKTKLNKILWKADFSAFAARGMPVTGRPYQRLQAGPAPVEMVFVLEEMIERGQLEIQPVTLGPHTEQRVCALEKPSLHFFSSDDLEYVDRAVKEYWELSARETSDDSHGVAWKTRDNLDPMPYETALLSDEELAGSRLTRLKELASELGWKSQ